MPNIIEQHPALIIGAVVGSGLIVYAIREGKSLADIFAPARVVAPNMAGGTIPATQPQFATEEQLQSVKDDLEERFNLQNPPPSAGGGTSVEEQSIDIWQRPPLGDAMAVGW